ncbi:MAG: hypothetical protein RMJ98_22545, partial [Myxococcales bacterium]|nr:hypothetical protein [Polyangiaceae bacterium]MDW8252084.1 hypothetical protein [Myxococcales bacterium]
TSSPTSLLDAALRGVIPRLRAQGFLGASWAQTLSRGVLWSEGNPFRPRLRLWTGLLVRPMDGLWLRLSCPTNRRNVLVSMEPLYFYDTERFTPLVVEFEPVGGGLLRLVGEIATVAPVAPRATFRTLPLARAPEVGEAHGAFYDPAYFQVKKGEITRKYRKLIGHQPQTEAPGAASCRLIEAGPAEHEIREVGPFLGGTRSEPLDSPEGGGRLQEVIFKNLVPFRVNYDGHTVAVDPNRDVLAAGARAVEHCFAEALGANFQQEHQGALWYLTKYFTPHPAGEAHFFVKPWAFVTTPPGWSCLLDGIHGVGYDILRGVVSTDLFHATPAVFWLHRLHTSIHVPRGTPLLRVLPVPRSLLTAGYRRRGFLDEGRTS